MNDYIAVRVNMPPASEDAADLAAAFLADVGFESFVPDDSGLTAYIRAELPGLELAKKALEDFPFESISEISAILIKGKDWNAEWEKNYFKPIIVGDECVVHSSFHKDVPNAQFEIIIDPKMAFGTGHHDTTAAMMRHILSLPFTGKSVIDVGTGTGILAILAYMKGAAKVTGIEIDGPAYENAGDNALINNCNIAFIHSDASALSNIEKSDYLFANINRNIILEDLDKYTAALKENGTMLLSGFYEKDIPLIINKAAQFGLTETDRIVTDKEWAALRLKKKKL